MMSANRRLKVPRLLNPTTMQISVTVRLTERSSSHARSTRRRVRYLPGVSPYAPQKALMNWPSEYPASAARSATASFSA